MPSYNIQVSNKYGHSSHYIVTQELPEIQGSNGPTWPVVIANAKVPEEGVAKFSIEVPNPHYAYAISTQGSPGYGSNVQVISKLPIELGRPDAPGSTLQYDIVDEVPRLKNTHNPRAPSGAFEIVTGEFERGNGDDVHHLIGYGNEDGPWTAVTPAPSVTYSFTPSKVFYLTPTSSHKGNLVDVETFGKSLKIDFNTQHGTARVTQNARGELVIDE